MNFRDTPYKQQPKALSVGAYGADYITDAVQHVGPFGAILAIEDIVFDVLTEAISGENLAGMPLARGMTIFGKFNTVELTSGKAYAYFYEGPPS